MKNKAGKETQILSFIFILTINPDSISRARPRDEIIKIGLNTSPTIKPIAPAISNKMVNKLNFCNPYRMNSCFICGDTK